VTSPTTVASPEPDLLAACAAYRRIARAIAVIRAAGPRPPDLATLARRVGQRPETLQRVFGAWAGVSPKRFAQALAAVRARVALGHGKDVLTSAFDAGVSGPGRLHDLLVAVEACSPGEVRSRGLGIAFACGTGPTPFGEAFVAATARGIHRLAFVDGPDAVARERGALAAAWPRARVRDDGAASAASLARVFARTGRPRPLHLWIRGTNFQIAVWRALLRVPPGGRTTYADVATLVAAPRAVRAVAGAVARNPVAWAIPCHRVLRGDGDLAGYAWGLDRKAAILGWEATRPA
jgi:AraC family transcriptional regulator of adaptative response/methylated-DNA-[protein]-cysteine methyltransferase